MIKFIILSLIFSAILFSCSNTKTTDKDLTFPNDENGDVLRVLQKNGFDFSTEHIFDYEHIFASEDSAQKFANEIKRQNLSAKVSFYEEASSWNVTVKVKHEPTHAKISETESELNNLAGQFGGRKDGWGVLQEPQK